LTSGPIRRTLHRPWDWGLRIGALPGTLLAVVPAPPALPIPSATPRAHDAWPVAR
jgi:hypothetical protein